MLRTRFSKILLGGLLLWSAAASAHQAWTTGQVNVRAGPDRTYPAVATLAPGYPVSVAGCLSDYSWCDVVFNNGYNRGWIPSRRIQYNYGGRRVPLYDYSSAIGLPIVTFSLLGYWDNYYRNRSWYGQRERWYGAPYSNWSNDRRDYHDDHRDFRHDRRDFRDDRRDNRMERRDDRHDWRDDGNSRRDNRYDRRDPPPRGEQPRFDQPRQDNPRNNRGGEGRGGNDGRPGFPQGQAPQAHVPQVQAPRPVPAQPILAPSQPRVDRNDQPRYQGVGRPDGPPDRPRQRESGQN